MKRTSFERFVVMIALAVLPLGACSGGASSSRNPGTAGQGGGAGTTGAAGNSSAAAGTTGGSGSVGTVGAAGDAGMAGAGAAGVTGAAGASAGTAGASAGTSVAGSGGAAGVTGAAGTAANNADGSTDTGASVHAFPSTQTVKMMVVGSSNEIGTCWRAFLWQELHMNGITNFDFVGQQNGGPNCGITAWNDTELQAMSGIIITGLPASTYASWFKANPPDVILMHFGGADILAGKPVDGVMQSYSVALAQARIVNPNVVLLIAQHTPEGKDAILTLNADIATWAVQNNTAQSPVIAVDLYTGILPSDQSDGVHLNASGSQKVADRFYQKLVPFFKP
jgi:hypothetical protein